ncbi:MAG: NAD(P)-dependent oxidoreductase [Alphaproteobacteria bacterium]|nr:NAD(P)-dependent oxidoreductase [Alphaproteobacteria bacterium]
MTHQRIAVTGGSGRLGRFVVAELGRDRAVMVLDRTPPRDDVAFAPVDIMDLPSLRRALRGCDAVVHLAGVDLDFAVADDEMMRVNAMGSWHVLQAAEELGIGRVILCSSVCASGVNEARPDFPPLYLPVDEDHPCQPNTAYGLSKLALETMGAGFARRGMAVLSLRPTLVMVADIVGSVIARAADPAQRSLYYYVTPEDAARGFRCALDAENVRDGAFFLTAADSCRTESTLDWLPGMIGAMPAVKDAARFAANPRASVFSGERARRLIGFAPGSNWLEIAARHRGP